MSVKGLSEEETLQRLIKTVVPERTAVISRLEVPVTLRGLTGEEVFSIQARCTSHEERGGRVVERLDQERFNAALVVAATVRPNWGDPKLLERYGATGPEEVVEKLLLAGELAALADAVLDLSGFNAALEEVKGEGG